MTREAAACYPYGSAGETPRPVEGVATPAQLAALAEFHARETARRDMWRHTAGLDSNGHGQIIHEMEGAL